MGSWLVVFSAFGFSTLGVFGKMAMDAGLTRNQALFYRFLISLPVLAIILRLTNAYPKNRKALTNFGRAVVVGAIGIGVEATLYFLTLEHLGAALTGIFLYLYPMFVALISHYFLREHLSRQKWLSVGVALIGSVLTVGIVGGSSEGMVSPLQDIAGLVFGILTGAWYAVYIIVGNRMTKGENPMLISSGVVLGSFITFTLLTWIEITNGVKFVTPHTFDSLVGVFGLGLMASVLPFTTLYAGMKQVGAMKASLLSTLELVFTILLAVLFLDEKLTLIQTFGAALILLSVLLATELRRK